MFYTLLNRSYFSEHPLQHNYKMVAFKDIQEDGVLKRTTCVERVDTSISLNKFKVSDFKLQNILAIGAYDMLRPQTLTDTNPLSVMSDLESRVNSVLKNVGKENE